MTPCLPLMQLHGRAAARPSSGSFAFGGGLAGLYFCVGLQRWMPCSSSVLFGVCIAKITLRTSRLLFRGAIRDVIQFGPVSEVLEFYGEARQPH